MADETTQVVTVDEVLAYLGIDYSDDMTTKNIERSIKTADRYLKSSIGEDYPVTDPRSKELALIVVADLFDNRGLHSQVSTNIRKLVDDFSLQMRLELRRSANGE